MPDHRAGRFTRTRIVALLLLGVLIGTLLITPAGAHVGDRVSHLWKKHIRPKADARYYKKANLAWAVVNANGTLAQGKRVNLVSKPSGTTGNYVVVFPKDVSECAYQATVRSTSSVGEIGAEPLNANANAVLVNTRSSAGNEVDRAFQLVVICG
jgi:hypothetical protein